MNPQSPAKTEIKRQTKILIFIMVAAVTGLIGFAFINRTYVKAIVTPCQEETVSEPWWRNIKNINWNGANITPSCEGRCGCVKG